MISWREELVPPWPLPAPAPPLLLLLAGGRWPSARRCSCADAESVLPHTAVEALV